MQSDLTEKGHLKKKHESLYTPDALKKKNPSANWAWIILNRMQKSDFSQQILSFRTFAPNNKRTSVMIMAVQSRSHVHPPQQRRGVRNILSAIILWLLFYRCANWRYRVFKWLQKINPRTHWLNQRCLQVGLGHVITPHDYNTGLHGYLNAYIFKIMKNCAHCCLEWVSNSDF